MMLLTAATIWSEDVRAKARKLWRLVWLVPRGEQTDALERRLDELSAIRKEIDAMHPPARAVKRKRR